MKLTGRHGGEWSATWRTARWGRRGQEAAPGAATRTSVDARVEYAYSSGLVEWYVNRPEGLEQGFRIATRPAGEGALSITGELPVGLEAQPAGDTVELLDAQGSVRLRYGALHVFDASGRELASRLEVAPRAIRLLIDDTDAVYPVDVDPTFSGPIWSEESDQSFANFGWAASTAGDVNGDGYSDVIVGIPAWDGGVANEGRVQLYLGSATGLATTPHWAFEANQAGAQLGLAVSPAGDVNGDGFDDFLVGAPYYDSPEANEGKVFLFIGSATTPSVLHAFEMDEEGALFGFSVGCAGDVNGDGYSDVIAGAPEWGGFGDPIGVPIYGAARIYHGGPTPDATLDWGATGGQTNMRFGCSVAGAGDVNGDGYDDILVGANMYDLSQFNPNQGTVRCWYGSAAGISGALDWQFFGATSGDSLGFSVAGAGDIDADGYADVIVGAPGYTNGQSDEGAAYIVRGGASGLNTFASARFEGDLSLGRLGRCVATAGDLEGDGHAEAIAGAAGTSPGRVLLVFWGPLGEGIISTLLGGPLDAGWYGWSVGTAGDVDGDGISEVLVGAPTTAHPETGEGVAYLYEGGVRPLSWDPRLINGAGMDDNLGRSVANAGDVNGDGYADLVVGAPGANTAYVFEGSPTGPGSSPDWSSTCEEANASFGDAVASAGDVNGDGYADIIVGAPLYDAGFTNQGLCRFFFGSASGVQTSGAISLKRNEVDTQLGDALAAAGDVNGDGYDDFLVGAPFWDNATFANAGAAFLYRGGPSGPLPGPLQYISVPQTGARTGTSVGAAGDLDADGFADILVGAPLWDGPSDIDNGKVVVARGGPTGLVSPSHSVSIGAANARSGWTVGTAGDVNADGFSDVVIGSPQASAGNAKVVVWYGDATPSGLRGSTYSWWYDFPEPGTLMATCTAGDLTGDGLPEIAVGYPSANANDSGRLLLHYGGADAGATPNTIPQIPVLRTLGGDPVALGGRAPEAGVHIAALARSAAGRTRARVEYQVAPMGQAFPAIAAGSFMDSGLLAAPTELSAPQSLAPDTRYRWRVRVATSNPCFPHGRWMTSSPTVPSLPAFRSGVDVTDAPALVDVDMREGLLFESLSPNPSRGATVAAFSIARRGHARVDVVDVAGRRVVTLVDRVLEAGAHVVKWEGAGPAGQPAAAGVYFVRVAANDDVATKKIVRVP